MGPPTLLWGRQGPSPRHLSALLGSRNWRGRCSPQRGALLGSDLRPAVQRHRFCPFHALPMRRATLPTQSPGGPGKAGTARLPKGTPAVPPSRALAAMPSSQASKRCGRTHGPGHRAVGLTLVEAELVPQDHHAFCQQLVLKGTQTLSLSLPLGGGVADRAPESPSRRGELPPLTRGSQHGPWAAAGKGPVGSQHLREPHGGNHPRVPVDTPNGVHSDHKWGAAPTHPDRDESQKP